MGSNEGPVDACPSVGVSSRRSVLGRVAGHEAQDRIVGVQDRIDHGSPHKLDTKAAMGCQTARSAFVRNFLNVTGPSITTSNVRVISGDHMLIRCKGEIDAYRHGCKL